MRQRNKAVNAERKFDDHPFFNDTDHFPFDLCADLVRIRKCIPRIIIQLFVSERDTALLNVAYFYNRDVKESIGRIQAMIEPAMTLILGAILGWVMLSVLGPIYDVITKLKF